MDDNVRDRLYEPSAIPPRKPTEVQERRHANGGFTDTGGHPGGGFTEIEIKGAEHNRTQKPAYIPKRDKPVHDEKRELFNKMRRLSGETFPRLIKFSGYGHRLTLLENSRLFYKQAVFMQDFTDDYGETAYFTMYFPSYQQMGYRQLRTYFTWRTQVRAGIIKNISPSYAYVYIYELLCNIGVSSPQDGLEKLCAFWKAYRKYDKSIDSHLYRWLRDYHIYYNLPESFNAFMTRTALPSIPQSPPVLEGFELYCGISKYNVRRSVFYTSESGGMLEACFEYVLDKLRLVFQEAGLDLDSLIYRLLNYEVPWTPFRNALFYPWLEQPDRRVIFSDKEIYICRRSKWTSGTIADNGRRFVGYIMKKTEASLRDLTRYKRKLSVNLDMLDSVLAAKLERYGIPLDKTITAAVIEYYAEINRKVVTVDARSLERIRRDALETQEKLIVEDSAEPELTLPSPPSLAELESPDSAPPEDEWVDLKNALSAAELSALRLILQNGDLQNFAAGQGMMTEVLIDGINQKAYDTVGDNILDFSDIPAVYDEYAEKLSEMVME